MMPISDSLSALAEDPPLLGVGQNELSIANPSVAEEWLRCHRLWGQLPLGALPAIAQSLYCVSVNLQTLIY